MRLFLCSWKGVITVTLDGGLGDVILSTQYLLYASKNSKRDYIFIDDLCDLIEKGLEGGYKNNYMILNEASGNSYSVYDIMTT